MMLKNRKEGRKERDSLADMELEGRGTCKRGAVQKRGSGLQGEASQLAIRQAAHFTVRTPEGSAEGN